MKKNHDSLLKILYDYLPLAVFFLLYKFSKSDAPLLTATAGMIICTIFALIVGFILTKKVSKIALFSCLILGFFGGLTIILKDETFIKIKPTIINLIFAAILLYGYFTKKPLLSHLFGSQIQIKNHAWLTLSLRWAIFFIFLAGVNEIIWRNFPTDFWVQFKVFGMMPLSIIFTFSQMPFMMREMKNFQK